MSGVFETRLKKLESLIQEYGTAERLAQLSGQSAAYLRQCRTGHRNIGEKLARSIESELGLPPGWMDHLDDSSPSDHVPPELAYFRRLNRQQREAIVLILESMIASQKPRA